ncbi:MAM and LDL-receptor class A domain-containing protein 1-like [Xenia sp. Carnegie-2017]|uniref:MAM and LDL-receptor class A domain-containing protein 1-like n=1 Tax=Xenia sp. Carnegie-2017 TaxID=2897299 RepID=UPI001F03376F|nr:MAM and LDL-receptor class A domain-containing protein 1-like [Xenia sp. Carnegie-2017]
MFSEICPLEGKCSCAKNVVNKSLEGGKRVANIYWSEPENFTCPHKYIKEGEGKSNISSPQSFLKGQHKIPYKHFLYGGKTSTCYVHINVISNVCDFESSLGTNLCPWHNDDYSWIVRNYGPFGRYLYFESTSTGKAWLVGNYRNDSLVCFSFSYRMYVPHFGALNIYQEYFHNGYNPLLWSLSGDQGNKWKKGQVTVNFTMGLSRLIVEDVVQSFKWGYLASSVSLDNLAFAPGSCDTIPKVAIPSNAFDCSNGSFFSFLNTKCNKCPSSTYQPYTSQTRCLTCNDGKGTINIGAVSEQECIKVENCDFQKGLGTTVCPWRNVEVDDDLNWELGTAYVKYRRFRNLIYDATGSNFGRYLLLRSVISGKAWLVGNYRKDSLVCFSFSYYIRSHYNTLNIYQEYFHNGYNPLLWSLSGDQGTKWKKGQVTVNFTMGLSKLIVEAVVRSYTRNVLALDNLAFAPGSCDTIPKVAIPSNAFDCSIGSFFSFKSKKCEKCPIYTYQPYPKQTRCLPCNESKGTINVGAVSERECIKVKRCDFQKGLGTTLCPWHNVEGDDDFDWKLSTSSSSYYDPPRYDATGFSTGRYLRLRSYISGKGWLVGNYRNDSLVCFSFSYYMDDSYDETLNIYQEYFHNGYNLLLWSLSGDQGTKWKKAKSQLILQWVYLG